MSFVMPSMKSHRKLNKRKPTPAIHRFDMRNGDTRGLWKFGVRGHIVLLHFFPLLIYEGPHPVVNE